MYSIVTYTPVVIEAQLVAHQPCQSPVDVDVLVVDVVVTVALSCLPSQPHCAVTVFVEVSVTVVVSSSYPDVVVDSPVGLP